MPAAMVAKHSTPEQAFAEVLRTARLEAGLTQERLAQLAGLDRTYISLLERGLRQPTLRSLLSLAEAVGRDPAELIEAVIRIYDADN